mmetsp:Transcript_18587/g.74194  ORF Transcript_18587/g.74194 Transcript_18587/m.74194 type:complete len:341 (-) Transcript_18587:64-1086(-)
MRPALAPPARRRACWRVSSRRQSTVVPTSDAAYRDRADLDTRTYRDYPCVAARDACPGTASSSKYLTFALPSATSTLGAGVIASLKVRAVVDGVALDKSYSPTSHPETRGSFELLVKPYPPRPGGGLGASLCALRPGVDAVSARVKPQRPVHGTHIARNRWREIGCLVGGTGIAPALNVIETLLGDPADRTRISVLASYRDPSEALGLDRIDELAAAFPGRLRAHATFTRRVGGDEDILASSSSSSSAEAHESSPRQGTAATRGLGRVDAAMARAHLPDPAGAEDVLVVVCGTDGFVASMAGPITRERDPRTGAKHKVQGPTLGVLGDELGFQPHQVMKL